MVVAVDEKVAPARGPSRRKRRTSDEPAIVITPPPVLPPSGEELLPSAKPASRRQQFIWGLRYYGFVGGLIALIVIVLSLTVIDRKSVV